MQESGTRLIPLFDLAVRLFHWLQLLLLGALWYSAEQEWYGLHQTLAYVLAALLGARLVWGFIGSDTARFAHFVPTPSRLKHYLTGNRAVAGHNPVSAVMILALLILVALQFISGLMTSDDVMTEGPLYNLVPDWLRSLAGSWHELGFNLLLGLVAVHVTAALWHQRRGDKVISAMWHGQKSLPADTVAPRQRKLSGFLIVLLLLLGVFAGWQGSGLWPQLFADLQAIAAQ